MKISRLPGLAAVALLALVGCSSDDVLQPSPGFPELPDVTETKGESETPSDFASLSENQKEAAKSLLNPTSAALLRLSSLDFYTKYGDSKWEKQDLTLLCGFSAPAHYSIALRDGEAWVPFETMHCYGPHPVNLPLWVYSSYTGFNKSYYISCPVEFNDATSILTVGKYEYQVCAADEKDLKVRLVETFPHEEEKTVDCYLYDICYEKEALDDTKILFYDTELDASLAIIDMVRDRLGSQFNANHYLSGVILNDPYVDLDEIEAKVRAMYASAE